MFHFLRSRSREIKNVQSIDQKAGASTDTKNNEQKNQTPRMGSILRHFRSFHTTETSRISHNTDDSFTGLPPEIITRVLYYLPLRDRKNVRLTCKLLNHCSKDVSITRMEKFHFPRSCSVPYDEILSQTDSAVLNLEFRTSRNGALSDSRVSSDVWKTCGDRVRSVSFYGFPQTHVLLEILMHCAGLQSILFHLMRDPKSVAEVQLLSVLNDLIELNITRFEVRFFEFSRVSNDDILRSIFTVFPNVEHLHAEFDDLALKTECLEPFMQLRSLTYLVSAPSVQTYWSADQIAPELPKRLTKFRRSPPDSNLCPFATESFLLRFLAVQDELEVLHLSIPYFCARNWGKEVMFHVLRSCPKLREFSFPVWDTNWKFETSDEVTEFVALISNLRFLKLGWVPRIPKGLLPSLPSTKFMLRTFAVTRSSECDEVVLLHILKHSPKMQHLYIDDARETLFRAAFRYMPELRSLILRDQLLGDVIDDWNPLDVEGLQNLKYMELWLYRGEALPIQQIKFQRLEYVKLMITVCPGLDEDTYGVKIDEYRKILWNMPALETACLPVLELENRREPIELFQNVKRLRHLICHSVASRILGRLFKSCPNLELVSDIKNGCTSSFDSSTKRIVSGKFRGFEFQFRVWDRT